MRGDAESAASGRSETVRAQPAPPARIGKSAVKRPESHGERDGGWTLIEVVVSMSIMAVFLAMMTGGIIEVFRVSDSTDAVADTQAQINVAFLRLDREVRYASDFGSEAQLSDGNWYVEYLSSYSGTNTCYELRLNTSGQMLQARSWTKGGTVPSTWAVLASHVTALYDSASAAYKPFKVSAPADPYAFARLTLNLRATGGTGATTARRDFTTTFTAMDARTSSGTACVEGRSSP